MLDDMPALRDAFEAYRGAAIAAGVARPDPPDADGGPPPPLVYRLFDVDHVAEQLIWLQSQGWDSSPVLPVADALSLGQHVDAVVFSILRNVSRLPAVQASQQRLASLGIRMLGTVVLGTNAEAGNLGYPYPARANP